ncbi:MAG TPA: hypothetical protein VF916_00310, partial [Ktedonobacterales bacterium]
AAYEDRANWDYYEVPATDCPRISAAFLAEERRSMPESWFASEYLCQFVDDITGAFRYEDVMGAFTPDVLPLFAHAEATAAAVGPITPAVRPLFAKPAEEFHL